MDDRVHTSSSVSDPVTIWEEIHRDRQWGTCPEPVMARFMMRRFGAAKETRPIWVLDLGCGSGAQTLWLAMAGGFKIDAVDASPSAIARANKLVSRFCPYAMVEFQVADARQLPFEDGIFDAVLDVGCIQHVVDDQDKAIAEAFRVLRPGGWLFSMMASPEHSISAFGDMPVKTHRNAHNLVSKWAKPIIVEKYHHSDRLMTIAHWAIEAQKAA